MSQDIEQDEYVGATESDEFSEDVFESMLNGTFEEESEEYIESEEDTIDDEHQEDTDLEDGDEEDNTDELIDGEADEEEIDEDVDEEENTLVEDYDLDEETDDTELEDEVDEATDEVGEDADDEEDSSEDDTEDSEDTDETSDGKSPETPTVDYKAFYDAVVNTEFTVNGRKSKGFSDPKKIIQSMQMAGGFSDKMAGFKQYRPYMAPLKDRGMLEDQTKFDLAMNMIDGDKEAIKQHLQALNIDPMELDMESINYSGKSTAASAESLVIDDSIDRAKRGGYEDRFRKVIGSDWDSDSFSEFVSNPQVRSDLLEHMESGAYERVQDKMAEMGRIDVNGTFGNMNAISKYRAAVVQLQAEAPVAQVVPEVVPVETPVQKTSVKSEKAIIKKERDEASYKRTVAAKNAKVDAQRKRAASMSKKKPKATPKAKFDPLKVEGKDLDDLMDMLISGGRG